MPSTALLGATGQVGQAVLSSLFNDTNHTIHAFVRSESKLRKLSPEICQSPRVKIFEGSFSSTPSPDSTTALAKCLTQTSTVILCVAETTNHPNCSIASDTAHAAIAAIQHLEASSTPYPRRLVMLSSAETCPTLSQQVPWPMRDILYCANSNIYHDLEAAEAYLRSSAVTDLGVVTTFVKPGGISHDVKRGHVLSKERQQTFVSFMDVGAGMVQVVVDSEGGDAGGKGRKEGDARWDMQTVSVLSPSGKARAAYENVPMLLKGLLVYFVPWSYGWLF